MVDDASLQTIPALLSATLHSRVDELALGTIREGELTWRTWREVIDDAAQLARVIEAAGVEPGDCVAQVSENRYEWIITDLAIHLARAVHVPLHITLSGTQMAEQIQASGARLVFATSEECVAQFADELDSITEIRVHDHGSQESGDSEQGSSGSDSTGGLEVFQNATTNTQPNDLTTILFTSGTTGRPRGVMLSQRNLATNAVALADLHGGGADQLRIGVLPLSHIYARTCDFYTWIYRGSRLVLAERRETLVRDCQLAQPTTLSAVPYVYQRIADGVRAAGTPDDAATLRGLLGGNIERLTCGGAALAPEVERWFADCGLPVYCGYGLTETGPVVSASSPTVHQRGCVGQPLPGVELKLADDGEVFVRGPNVMLGYWQDAAATAEAIRDGWLATGDLGELDAEGFLKIVGRKKELIVLSTGKKVSPSRVEGLLTGSPLVEQAFVCGEGQTGLVALIVPSGDRLQAAVGQDARELMAAEIKRSLADAAHEEQVHRFALVERPFSIERGELTAKLSLRREAIVANFAAELEILIAQSEPSSAGQSLPNSLPSLTSEL